MGLCSLLSPAARRFPSGLPEADPVLPRVRNVGFSPNVRLCRGRGLRDGGSFGKEWLHVNARGVISASQPEIIALLVWDEALEE